jgi:hypothetical protein
MDKELTYPVNRKLSHDGEQYSMGDTVALTEEQAAPLLKIGVIAEASVLVAVAEAGATLKPEGDDLTQAIMCVIEELDSVKDFTKGGFPKAASVIGQLSYDVSAAEIAYAWDGYPEGDE